MYPLKALEFITKLSLQTYYYESFKTIKSGLLNSPPKHSNIFYRLRNFTFQTLEVVHTFFLQTHP